jgi:hypothetical protein
MPKIFEWQDAIRVKPRKSQRWAGGQKYEVLLWVHDPALNISYMWHQLCYWDGENWIKRTIIDEKPLLLRDVIVVNWCYVPRSRAGLVKKARGG